MKNKKEKKQFKAIAKYIRKSPFKLRPIVDKIRGKNAEQALSWLKVYNIKKTIPVRKVVESAVANAKDLEKIEKKDLTIKEIRVDNGPIYKYFKPGAQGRSKVLRRRLSHIQVLLDYNL